MKQDIINEYTAIIFMYRQKYTINFEVENI